ncbi:hypothetical protein LSCM1_01481 [Leishmania martiniquensis]|uniref:Uncharacterized protein n=1 Tax=Leishmania martiniquensis TaxID=1580590 RepID=A0A836KG22_9TRYP|nr:hypothetical protein LSCM1_01481 [Leishmania martiniquensis]
MKAASLLSRGPSRPRARPPFPLSTSGPQRPSERPLAVRAAHAPAMRLQACVPLVLSRRHLSSGNGCRRPPSITPAVSVTDGSAAPGEDDEDLKLDIYRPPLSPEEAERKAKTDLFLCLLLTVPREQDWKDMLTAAFRAGTWKPHHLQTVLRGVQLNMYNKPAERALSCAGRYTASMPSSRSAALRHSVADVARTAPPSSTPSARLQRARDIFVFCAEEGPVYAPPSGEEPFDSVSAPPSSPAEAKTSRCSQAFAPSPADAHHLLVLLLQAAQRGVGATPSLSQLNATSKPVASFHDVWHFLAWMELHGYHVLSDAVLAALEAVVDEGGSQAGGEAAAGLTAGSGSSSSALPSPLQYALVSQRVHRLDYLRGERALLRQSMKSAEQGGDGTLLGTGAAGEQRRQRDVPRTAPVQTE